MTALLGNGDLKVNFYVSIDDQDTHPDDLSVSVTNPPAEKKKTGYRPADFAIAFIV